MDLGNRRLQYWITSAVSTTAITNGVSFSWITPVLPKFYNNETDFPLTEVEISWVVALPSLGWTIGSLASRLTSDRYGRRATLLSSLLPIGIGLILLLFAREVWMVCIARILWGCGSGMIGSVSGVYIAETSDKDLRGRLLLSNRFMFSFGCLLALAIGPFLTYGTFNYCLILLPVISFIACWLIPETPYFLLKEGKVDAARETLMKLTLIKDEEVLETRLSQMRSDVMKEMTRSCTVMEFLTGKQYRKAIIIVVGSKITQLMAGLHAVQLYLGPIIQESKFEIYTSTALIIFGVARFTAGIISSQLVDRLGRRPLMIYSFLGTGVCFGIVGAFFFFNVHTNTFSSYSFIPFVGITLAIVISVLGFESVAYMIPAELFPINIKSIALSATNIFAGLISFISVKSYQPIKDLGGLSAVMWVYTAASILGAVFSYICLTETKCKSLRQIQIDLNGDIYDQNNGKLRPEAVLNNDENHQDGEGNELKALRSKDEV